MMQALPSWRHIPFSHQTREGTGSEMKRVGLKAPTAVLTIGRRSGKHVDWTLLITIFSTIVTLSLIALYVWQRHGGL
jgi:hypothetical protein